MLRALIPAALAAASAVAMTAPAYAQVPSYTTKGPTEAKYLATGPWTVTKTVSATACDSENRLCDIFRPTNLGTNPIKGIASGFKHPVISWANGSGQQPAVYEYLLRHLASWGFIVVASRDDGTGNGATTSSAAQYMINQGNTASSTFYNKVDTANFAALGHSQGAASVVNLHARKNPLFKTFVAYHTSPWFFSLLCCNVTPSTYNNSGVTKSILHWTSDPDSGNLDWYNPVPAPALKAHAQLKYTNHGDVGQGNQINCANSGCGQGTYGYLGYSTAWLMWQLQGATDGANAFKPGGEFFLQNASWSMNVSNIP